MLRLPLIEGHSNERFHRRSGHSAAIEFRRCRANVGCGVQHVQSIVWQFREVDKNLVQYWLNIYWSSGLHVLLRIADCSNIWIRDHASYVIKKSSQCREYQPYGERQRREGDR